MRRPTRKTRALKISENTLDPLLRLWILRLLIKTGGHRNFISAIGFKDDALAQALGFETDVDLMTYDHYAVHETLRDLLRLAETAIDARHFPAELAGNLTKLTSLIGLSEVDCQILAFALLLHTDGMLYEAACCVGDVSTTKLYHVLADVLAIPVRDIRLALSSQSLLSQTGLVTIDSRIGPNDLRSKIDLLNSGFADRMLNSEDDPVSLLKDAVFPSRAPTLRLSDFPHTAKTLDLLRPYLCAAREQRLSGVNVFIYGPPGTGKSELARLLAKDLGCTLFEVASEDEDGDPIVGPRRLRAFRAAQCFLAHQPSVLLFDETEDVFSDGMPMFGRRSTAQNCKAWINRMLEENPIPTFWLSNSVECMDPAFIRRFDMVLELGLPPKAQRARIIREACGDLLTEDATTQLIAAQDLTPAVVTRAASVVRRIQGQLPDGAASDAMLHLVENTLIAQGHSAPLGRRADMLPAHYDPGFLQTDSDLTALVEGIRHSRSARLCLYGPPGTGKTAFGRWLADCLGVPLHAKRVSDIVSPYVGMTERNLAAVFRAAQKEGAVLLLDEVDSFLQDRRQAQRPWEVTEVNEMLTQMEAFGGVFIASTNLVDALDPASLRRFDLKIKFDYLQPEPAWRLFLKQCDVFGLDRPSAGLQSALRQLTTLTPGDFAAVQRQHQFRPVTQPSELLAALETECRMKEESRNRRIGFI